MRLLKIGRDAGNDIVLYSDKVSSHHAEITLLDSGDILLEDRGSRNGTFVMNNQIQPGHAVTISRGDAVRFADVELQWTQVPMPEDNSAYTALWGIGSNFHNEIQISGATVSRYHATVKKGKDGKMYIVDHSKNGTTVDGVKIPSKQPFQIKKSSVVVCGGVPVNLDLLSWPSKSSLVILLAVASVLLLLGVGFGLYKATNGSGGFISIKRSTQEISERYTPTTVMLVGMYHFEVTCGNLRPELLEKLHIPTKFYYVNGKLQAFSDDANSSNIKNASTYSASGFFISNDGMILTNLHVAKPWLFDGMQEKVENLCRQQFAKAVEAISMRALVYYGYPTGLSAYISQLKVEGVSDGIILIPQGAYYSEETAIRCHILSASDDTDKDIALIQSDKCEVPNRCSYVNVTDSMDISADVLSVGSKVVTIGFPYGINLQDADEAIKAFTNDGSISQLGGGYTFTFNATASPGASGSPVFNEYGKLIGILSSGVSKENIIQAVKAQYIKELLDSPHKK